MTRSQLGRPSRHSLNVVALLFVYVFGLITAAAAAGDIYFGEYRLIVDDGPAAPLERTAHGTATFALAFASEVGGVNFQAVLPFDTALQSEKPKLSYDATAPDGQRLRVTIKGIKYTSPLYDWQLRPIVAYSNSEYTAIVSLFGPGPDRHEYYYIQYHPAFQDTLLGLRLLQADMFLMDPLEMRKVSRTEKQPILGPGETIPDEAVSVEAATQLAKLIERKPDGSWIFTDVDTDVRLRLSAGELFKFAGTPYYFFWHPQAPSQYDVMAKLSAWLEKHPEAKEPDQLQQLENILQSGLKLAHDSKYTELMKDKYKLYMDANQTVFQSALYVMQYSAFFRAIKDSDPASWKAFVGEITFKSEVLRTPTRLVRRSYR